MHPLDPCCHSRTPPTEKLKIMKQQTSIHVQPVKGGSEQHNKREKELDYIRPELSHLNEYWEKDTQTDRLENVKSRYLKSTGQKMQAKATPIREAVVVIKPETTMEDLKRLSDAYRQRFGIDTFQIAIHKDEGYPKGEWKPNLHAHLVFDWTSQQTGKSLKLNRQDMVEMQTITAEILQMDRGVSSDKQHLTAQQYKSFVEEAKLRRLEEERLRKEKQMKEELERFKVGKARKEAAIEAAKTLSEGVKGLFGQSSKDKDIKALKSKINAQNEEISSLRANIIKLQDKATGKEEDFNQKLTETKRAATSRYNEVVTKHNSAVKENESLRKDIMAFQKIPIIASCINLIRNYVRRIDGRFNAEERKLLSFVMQGDECAAERLKNAAYYGCGTIGQWQYGSKWNQAERELRNIANGVREEEQQQQRRGLRR